MGTALNKKELKAALEKLREQYRVYGEKFDRQVFNLERFNERYMESLRIGMPVGHFLAGEVQTFRELKARAEEKYAPKDRSVSIKVDRMLEDFAERTRQYPPVDLCPRADEETCRLAGMLREFSGMWRSCLPLPRSLPPGSAAAGLARQVEERAFQLLEASRNGNSRLVEDFITAVSRITAGEREQAAAKKELFKESGFFLNLVRDLFREPEVRAGEDASEWVECALDAFRLQEFRLGRI